MNAVRQYTTVKDNVIQIHLPDEFNGQEVEIIVLTIQNAREQPALRARWEDFLADLPEPDISEEEILSEVKEARAARLISY